jgi:hypothetical protein
MIQWLDRCRIGSFRLRKIVLLTALSIGFFGVSDPLKAQVKSTRLPDGVVKYEAPQSTAQSPSFWEIFTNLFRFAPNNRPFERSFAFLVGVSSYKHLSPQLPYVKSDLEDLRQFLLDQGGFDVVYVASDDVVTAGLVEDYMLNRFPKEIGENDRLLFYYSGHGADIGGSTGYMQFGQAKKETFDLSQYLPITRTQEWSRIIKAKHILFLIDSCASGLGFESKGDSSNVDDDLLNTLSGNGSRFVITAGTAREKAFQVEVSSDHGYSVFTHSFLEVLRTSSDAYKEKGFLVLDEVFAEAKVRVGRFTSESGRAMTPRLWAIPRDGKDVGTFIFLNKDIKAVSASSITKTRLGISPKESLDLPGNRYARFLKGEIGKIGGDVPETVRKNVAKAILEMELTWQYGSTNSTKGDLLAGNEIGPTIKEVSQSPEWMLHFVDTARAAGFTLPVDAQWTPGDIDENRKLLSSLAAMVVKGKWSYSAGVTRLKQLLPGGQPLIVKEFLDISNREDRWGVWRLQLALGQLLEEGPNTDLTLRAYGTVIRWNNVSASNTLVEELVKYAGGMVRESEFETWFKEMAGMPYEDYQKQLSTAREDLAHTVDRITAVGSNKEGRPKSPQGETAPAAAQSSVQASQGGGAQTFLERVTQINRNLAKGDRDRLADAFFEYAQFLNQGRALYYKANSEGSQIQHGWQDGSIGKDFETHITKLREIDTAAWAYSKAFVQIREKWKYYQDQTNYIFGDNPDNLGPNKLINAVEAYANYLDRWGKIQNKDQHDVLLLLADEQNNFNDFLNAFMHWIQGCEPRLEEMRKSLQ